MSSPQSIAVTHQRHTLAQYTIHLQRQATSVILSRLFLNHLPTRTPSSRPPQRTGATLPPVRQRGVSSDCVTTHVEDALVVITRIATQHDDTIATVFVCTICIHMYTDGRRAIQSIIIVISSSRIEEARGIVKVPEHLLSLRNRPHVHLPPTRRPQWALP